MCARAISRFLGRMLGKPPPFACFEHKVGVNLTPTTWEIDWALAQQHMSRAAKGVASVPYPSEQRLKSAVACMHVVRQWWNLTSGPLPSLMRVVWAEAAWAPTFSLISQVLGEERKTLGVNTAPEAVRRLPEGWDPGQLPLLITSDAEQLGVSGEFLSTIFEAPYSKHVTCRFRGEMVCKRAGRIRLLTYPESHRLAGNLAPISAAVLVAEALSSSDAVERKSVVLGLNVPWTMRFQRLGDIMWSLELQTLAMMQCLWWDDQGEFGSRLREEANGAEA